MHVVPTLDMGGAEKLVLDMVRFGGGNGHKFVVCCLSEKGVLAAPMEQAGAKVVCLDKRYGLNFGISFQIAALAKAEDVSVIHAHNVRAQFYSAISRLIDPRPRLFCTRHHGRHGTAALSTFLLGTIANCFTDKVIFVSEDARAFTLKHERLPARKALIIKNGIDIARYAGTKTDKAAMKSSLGFAANDKLLGAVGSLIPIKNHRMLITALKGIEKEEPSCKVVIAGGGRLKDELKEYANGLGLGDKVVLLGERQDVAQLLGTFDVFVVSSSDEGMSLAILEALAAGLPVVATNVGGNPELVRDGENGFIVASEDAIAMGEAVLKVLSDSSLSAKMAENNRQKALREFDIRKMCREYEELYAV